MVGWLEVKIFLYGCGKLELQSVGKSVETFLCFEGFFRKKKDVYWIYLSVCLSVHTSVHTTVLSSVSMPVSSIIPSVYKSVRHT